MTILLILVGFLQTAAFVFNFSMFLITGRIIHVIAAGVIFLILIATCVCIRVIQKIRGEMREAERRRMVAAADRWRETLP